jgi:DNA-binding NtrC family response regulator
LNPRRILIVEDDRSSREALGAMLQMDGHHVHMAQSAEEALDYFREDTPHLVLADVYLPGKSGIELTKLIRDASPSTAVVLITGHGSIRSAVAALKRGAVEYVTKPISPKKLRALAAALLESRPEYLPNKLLSLHRSGEVSFDGMLARSKVMQNVFEKIKLAAQADTTVLITGESGTGKELVARSIHHRSRRSQGPFVAVNTGAIPRELIASELFGHERGSFTGATERKEGKFELSDGGTLFLDELSTMDEATQINLLRVLETFHFTRVGGRKERRANVRVVAATNRDLHTMVEAGEFREDLYYRLSIFNINLPPLRERPDDVPLLTSEFLRVFSEKYGKRVDVILGETLRLLQGYRWSGNVRELRNVVEQAVLLARGNALDPDLLPRMLHREHPPEEVIRIPLGVTMRDAEKEIILRTMEAHGGNKKVTAEVLGISRRSLYNKLAEYGVLGGKPRGALSASRA